MQSENECRIEPQEFGNKDICLSAKSAWKNRNMSMETKCGMYEGVIVPSTLYGCETLMLENNKNKSGCGRDVMFEKYVWSDKER